jgi:hypothetical protein
LARELDRLEPVAGLADDVEIRVGGEDLREAVTEERVIVDDEDANAGRRPVGERAQPVTSMRPSAPSRRR